MKKIYFATTNEGKLREAKEILGSEVEGLDIKVDEVQTLDPIECVEKKAEAAYKIAQRPIVVEDLSFFFEALNGLPGVFIDYFMKTIDNEGLMRVLDPFENRRAKAQSSFCYYDGKRKITATGIVEGIITKEAKGTMGFGWDPIFIPEGANKTFAEMDISEKNTFSMREKGLTALAAKLKNIE